MTQITLGSNVAFWTKLMIQLGFKLNHYSLLDTYCNTLTQ